MGARPMELPPGKLKRLEALLAKGVSGDRCAIALGISVATVWRVADRHGFVRRRGGNGGPMRRGIQDPAKSVLEQARESSEHIERVRAYWLTRDKTLRSA